MAVCHQVRWKMPHNLPHNMPRNIMAQRMKRVLRNIGIAQQKYPLMASFFAGALASLSLPPAYVMPAFLLFGIVLYHAAHAYNWRVACLHIGLGAYGWFLASLYWISHSLLIGDADYWFLIPLSFFGIPLIVASFWLVAGAIGYYLGKSVPAKLLFITMMLGLGEWGREFIATGFPWNAPGLVFLATTPSSYLAAYFGQTGLNQIAFMLAACLPLWLIVSQRAKRMLFIGMMAAIFGAGFLSWHHHHIPHITDGPEGPKAHKGLIRLVQPAIPQAEKWDASARAGHLAKMVSLSQQPAKGPVGPVDLVIWPEVAFAGNYTTHKGLVADLAGQVADAHRLAGG